MRFFEKLVVAYFFWATLYTISKKKFQKKHTPRLSALYWTPQWNSWLWPWAGAKTVKVRLIYTVTHTELGLLDRLDYFIRRLKSKTYHYEHAIISLFEAISNAHLLNGGTSCWIYCI